MKLKIIIGLLLGPFLLSGCGPSLEEVRAKKIKDYNCLSCAQLKGKYVEYDEKLEAIEKEKDDSFACNLILGTFEAAFTGQSSLWNNQFDKSEQNSIKEELFLIEKVFKDKKCPEEKGLIEKLQNNPKKKKA